MSVSTQSAIYACIGMDIHFLKTKEEVGNTGKLFSWYDFGPGGMFEATDWMQHVAVHRLINVSIIQGTPHDISWYYDCCEGYGELIAKFVTSMYRWPDEYELDELIDIAIAKHVDVLCPL